MLTCIVQFSPLKFYLHQQIIFSKHYRDIFSFCCLRWNLSLQDWTPNHLNQRNHSANKLTVVLNSQNSATLSFSPELKDSRGRPGSFRCQGSTFGVVGMLWVWQCSAGRGMDTWLNKIHLLPLLDKITWSRRRFLLLLFFKFFFLFFSLPWCIVNRQKKRCIWMFLSGCYEYSWP